MDETFESDPPVADGVSGESSDTEFPGGTTVVPPGLSDSLMPLSMPPFIEGSGTETYVFSPSGPPRGSPPFGGSFSNGGGFGGFGPGDEPRKPTRSHRLFVGAIVLALFAGGLGAGLGATFVKSGSPVASQTAPAPSAPNPAPAPSGGQRAQVSATVLRAVVDINTNVASAIGSTGVQAAGTGIILSPDGEILTNNHVVESATSISVTVQHRSRPYPARLLGVDKTDDVALIKIEQISGLPVAPLGNSATVVVHDHVVAIGNALGLGGTPAVVSGVISGTNQSITAGDGSGAPENLHGLFQTNAPIAQGDSGGPLVDGHGKVIGMDTAAATADGTGATIGYAIPINTARTIASSISAGKGGNGIVIGYSPFIGIENTAAFGGFGFGFGSGNAGTPSGVAVGGVIGGSPAAAAGLEGGDVITTLDGVSLTKGASSTAAWTKLQQLVGAHHPGDSISLTYLDPTSQSHTINLRLGAIPA